jgi:hypothetical protein
VLVKGRTVPVALPLALGLLADAIDPPAGRMDGADHRRAETGEPRTTRIKSSRHVHLAGRAETEEAVMTEHEKNETRQPGEGPLAASSGKVPKAARRWKFSRIVGVFVILGTIAAIVTLVVAFRDNGPSKQHSVQQSGSVNGGACAIVGNNNSCSVQQRADEVTRGTTSPEQIKRNVAQFSQNPPAPPGPWPFLIYDTVNVETGQNVGLSVKAQPLPGRQMGSTPASSIVWAECYVLNTYDPEQGNSVDVGPRWLKIKWPTNTPGTAYARSSPTDRFTGYVYAGYALPFTHNGSIPRCP